MEENFKVASKSQITKIISLITTAKDSHCLRTGINETTKIINKGKAQFVILALDGEPREIIMHVPILCSDKSVDYICLDSKVTLGKACGINNSTGVLACVIYADNDNAAMRNAKLVREILSDKS